MTGPNWRVVLVAVMVVVNGVLVLAIALRDANEGAVHGADRRPVATVQGPSSAPTAALLGDGFAAITAPAGPNVSYPLTAGRLLGWRMSVIARRGVGYVNGGSCGSSPTLYDFIDQAAAAHPDVVILAAGFDDAQRGCSPDVQSAAATRTLTELRRRLPAAVLAVVGPIGSQGVATRRTLDVRDGLQRAARAQNVPLFDPTAQRWVTGRRNLASSGNASSVIAGDGTSLTPAGHAAFGLRLASNLAALRPRSSS